MTTHQPVDGYLARSEQERTALLCILNDPVWGEASEAAAREMVGQLELHVCSRVGGRLRDFQVLVRENGLVLQGHAQTYYAKQLAQHAVMETSDLPILANEIEVGSSKAR